MSALTDQDALHIASELRSRRSTARKRNLKASKPLKVHPKPINADTTSQDAEVKRTALQQTLQVLDLLPANSTYAKHRRAIVQKALDLLDAERYLPCTAFCTHFFKALYLALQDHCQIIIKGTSVHVPVVIAGAGPTGLTLSILLGQLGIPNLVLDRATALPNHPQAHFINNRSMEIFRPLEGLADEIAARSPPLAEWRKFVYCESLTGRVFGQVDHFQGQTGPRMHDLSPEPVAHLSQHKLLPLLLHRAHRASGQGSVRFGHSLRHFQQHQGGISCSVQPVQGAPYQMQADYLIAADGASSSVRKSLGIQLLGDPAMQHLVNIYFFSKQLWQHVKERPAMLYFVFSSKAIVVLVAHNLQEGEMVAQVPYFPPVQSVADFPVSHCVDILRNATGLPSLEVDVKAVKTWNMSAQVAERFQDKHVFLAGDAAHRFPPAGAFGMNTGIQDAHNLAWKLAAVYKGTASPQLLDSYQAERHPVAQANTDLSVANWHEAVRVPRVLGLDPRAANLLNAVVGSKPMALLPSGFAKAALDLGLSAGLSVSGLYGPLKAWRERQLSQIFASGQTLRLQFPKEDLGFVYSAAGAAVCPETLDSRPAPGIRSFQSSASGLDGTAVSSESRSQRQGNGNPGAADGQSSRSVGASDRQYRPSCTPGGRLPHVMLQPLHTDGAVAGDEISTLDLLSISHWRLLLLLRCGTQSAAWAQIAAAVGKDAHCDVKAVSIFDKDSPVDSWKASGLSELEILRDLSGCWPQLSGVSKDGAVLVRPDGHVLWRCKDAVTEESMMRGLTFAIQRCLCK